MALEQLASGTSSLPLAMIGGDAPLARQIQERLTALGLLDPPADGSFGPVSLWAMGQFLRGIGKPGVTAVDAGSARTLLSGDPASVFPLNNTPTFAGRIARAMTGKGRWVCRHPDSVNVVYIEGMNADGTANDDTPNEFNDLRLILNINRNGNAQIVESWEGTTEPGRYYTLVEKLDPRGAARIAFGQYKSWSVGTHMPGRKSAHEALVQTAPITVFRDLNADFERTGDTTFTGLFGVNQHWGFDLSKSDIGRASAGCLLGRTKTGHRAFMALCKEDPRFQANNSYRFMTAVLSAADVPAV